MRLTYRADSVELDGYVVVTSRDSSPIRDKTSLGDYYFEQILPGTFDKELLRKEIPVLLNHDKGRKLGTSRTNFEFEENQVGLRVHAVILDPEVIRKAKAGKLRGWSFAFSQFKYEEEVLRPNKKRRERLGKDVKTRRKIWSFELEEISLIDDQKKPVYEGTSVILIDTDLEGKAAAARSIRELKDRLAMIETRRRINHVKALIAKM